MEKVLKNARLSTQHIRLRLRHTFGGTAPTPKFYLVIQIRANLIGIRLADLIGSAIHFDFTIVEPDSAVAGVKN